MELTLTVGEADGESLSLGLAFADVRGGIPDPAAVTADVGRQLHVGDDCENIHVSKQSMPISPPPVQLKHIP